MALAASAVAALLALGLATMGAVSLAGLLVVAAAGVAFFARDWLVLAERSCVGARSEDQVQRARAIPLGKRDRPSPVVICAKVGRVGTITGSSTAEINARIDRVWALVQDVERASEWQGGLKALRALDHDDQGRVTLCESESDAKVRTVKSTVRFTYDGPSTLAWRQEKGELKSVHGSWQLEDMGGGRTRATYDLEVDLGRMLGMVIRGPLVDVLRGMLVSARAGELKRAVEDG